MIFLHYALNKPECYYLLTIMSFILKFTTLIYPYFVWFTIIIFHNFLKCSSNSCTIFTFDWNNPCIITKTRNNTMKYKPLCCISLFISAKSVCQMLLFKRWIYITFLKFSNNWFSWLVLAVSGQMYQYS